MKKLLITIVALLLTCVSCSKDKVIVKHNDDRLTDLERRVLILEQLTSLLQSDVVQNAQDIAQEKQNRIDSLLAISDQLDVIQDQIDTLGEVDTDLQAQIDALILQVNAIDPQINVHVHLSVPLLIGSIKLTVNHYVQQIADLTSLQNEINDLRQQVNNHENRISDLENGMSNLNNTVDNLVSTNIEFVKLCPNSDELAMKMGSTLYAVGFTSPVGGGLVKLNTGWYYTTTNVNSACKFKVNADGSTSDQTYGHNISSMFTQTVSSPVVPTGTCSVVNQNNSSNSYLVTTSGSILNSSGELKIQLLGGATVTGHNYSGGGATVSNSGGFYNFKPNAGIANSFLIYRSGSGTLGTATITTGSNETITCLVTN